MSEQRKVGDGDCLLSFSLPNGWLRAGDTVTLRELMRRSASMTFEEPMGWHLHVAVPGKPHWTVCYPEQEIKLEEGMRFEMRAGRPAEPKSVEVAEHSEPTLSRVEDGWLYFTDDAAVPVPHGWKVAAMEDGQYRLAFFRPNGRRGGYWIRLGQPLSQVCKIVGSIRIQEQKEEADERVAMPEPAFTYPTGGLKTAAEMEAIREAARELIGKCEPHGCLGVMGTHMAVDGECFVKLSEVDGEAIVTLYEAADLEEKNPATVSDGQIIVSTPTYTRGEFQIGLRAATEEAPESAPILTEEFRKLWDETVPAPEGEEPPDDEPERKIQFREFL